MSLGAVIGFSLCAAALCVLLRQYRPEIALVISILCLPGHRGDGHRRPAGNGGQGRDAAAGDAGFLGAAPAGAAADRNIKGGGR